jgi:hypothetical protein
VANLRDSRKELAAAKAPAKKVAAKKAPAKAAAKKSVTPASASTKLRWVREDEGQGRHQAGGECLEWRGLRGVCEGLEGSGEVIAALLIAVLGLMVALVAIGWGVHHAMQERQS